MKYHIDADVSIDQNDPERFVVRQFRRGRWTDMFGPATREDCQDWCQQAVEDDRYHADHDPENIYGLASIRQSIEEDRR